MKANADHFQSGKQIVAQQPQIQNQSETSSKRIMYAPSSNAIPLRINADDQKKWKLVCYSSIIILAIVFLSLIAALALPKALMQVNQKQWVEGTTVQTCDSHISLVNTTITCASNTDKNNTSMGAFVTNLSPLNQFLVLYLGIKPAYYNQYIDLNQDVNFTLYTAQRIGKSNGALVEMRVTGQISTTNISLRGKVKDLFTDYQFFILYMSKLTKGDQFYWEVSFSNSSQIKPGTYYLSSQIVNPDFSYFTIFLRLALFVISFVMFLKYNKLILALPKTRVSVEQRTIQVLSVITLAFNDQIYFISVIAPNPYSSFLSSFFLWNFVAYLFMLWALFLNRIRNNEPQTNTFLINLPSGILAFVFYAVGMGYTVAYAITQTTIHPIFSFEDITAPGVVAMQIMAFIAVSLGCLYIIYLFIYILKYKPNRAYRHNIFMAISAVFFVCTVVFFFVGGYDLYSYSASKIIFTLCFMNMYSFFLQYLFAPTDRQIKTISQESLPLAAINVEMLDAGEILVDISDQREVEEKVRDRVESQIKLQGSEQSKSGSLSARQRRKKRKLKHLNKSKQKNEMGGTNEQIYNKNISLENQKEDEFN